MQIGSIFFSVRRFMPLNIASAIMKQKADSQEKLNANKAGQYEPSDRSGEDPPASERAEGTRAHVPAQSQPLESCLDCAATYDRNVNYANVLASLFLWLEAHVVKRTGLHARPTA